MRADKSWSALNAGVLNSFLVLVERSPGEQRRSMLRIRTFDQIGITHLHDQNAAQARSIAKFTNSRLSASALPNLLWLMLLVPHSRVVLAVSRINRRNSTSVGSSNLGSFCKMQPAGVIRTARMNTEASSLAGQCCNQAQQQQHRQLQHKALPCSCNSSSSSSSNFPLTCRWGARHTVA
jgi:hypothetical protein